MIIPNLYLYHFWMFETLHPPNSFLVFQAFYVRRLRHLTIYWCGSWF